MCNIVGHVVGPDGTAPTYNIIRKDFGVSGETALDGIGPEWAFVGPCLGPIKPDAFPKACKTVMPKVYLLGPYRESNQYPPTEAYDCNYQYALKSVRRDKSSSIWPESREIT